MAAAGSGPVEVALVSAAEAAASSGGGGCCSVWDVGSGASVAGYRGGSCAARGLALLGGEHLLGAQLGKACVGAWELQRKVSSGNLLAILNRHYQDLSCLAFTDDSSHFLSGAKDSLVIVWSLYSILQVEHTQSPEPWHVWSRHSLPITDLCCGVGGPMARAATASLDQTAKLWEISSGNLLLSVVFDVGIMSVTLDLTEYHMFCGGMDGSLFQVDLCAWPVQRERGFQTEREDGKLFKGHRNQVTCLSVSTDGSLLLSGSHDETVRLWDIQSKQCVRTVNYKGPVTNAFITLAPANMLNPDSKPRVPLPKFSRHLYAAESAGSPASEGLTLCLGLHQKGSGESYLEKAERLYSQMYSTREKNLMGDQEQLKIQLTELEEEVSTLRKINKSLFDFSSRIIIKPSK
ncbi:WD repeat-containing protein 18 isoform X2 [Rhineura floridana]|uniref:WD repeat-containing protein 18 isoform X2 n=1 Tax=Rhineura floridana TaxID=261503 RepID=UPI002AC7EC12|nr:WD repeat-containing protein 18 isoform X2 [Rhineura floridana]